MGDEVYYGKLFETAMREYYFSNSTVLSKFPWVSSNTYEAEAKLGIGIDNLPKKEDNEQVRKVMELSFRRFFNRLLNNGPILDAEGNHYDITSPEKGAKAREQLFKDFVNGKQIVFLGTGEDQMKSITANRDEMNRQIVKANRSRDHKIPSLFSEQYELFKSDNPATQVDNWTINNIKGIDNREEAKPTGGGWWNKICKKIWGKPSKRWEKYENHLKYQSLNSTLEFARQNIKQNPLVCNELDPEKVNEDYKKVKFDKQKVNSLKNQIEDYKSLQENREEKKEERLRREREELENQKNKEQEEPEETKEEIKEEIIPDKPEPTQKEIEQQEREAFAIRFDNKFGEYTWQVDDRLRYKSGGMKDINDIVNTVSNAGPEPVDLSKLPEAMAKVYLAQTIMRNKPNMMSSKDEDSYDMYNHYEKIVRGYDDGKAAGKKGVLSNLTEVFKNGDFYKSLEAMNKAGKHEEMVSVMTSLFYNEKKPFNRMVDAKIRVAGGDVADMAEVEFDKAMFGGADNLKIHNEKDAKDYLYYKSGDEDTIQREMKRTKTKEEVITKDDIPTLTNDSSSQLAM